MVHGKAILEEQTHQPECPARHSKNVQPISGVERVASIIGLAFLVIRLTKVLNVNIVDIHGNTIKYIK